MCDDIAYDGIKVLALKWGQILFEIASFPSSISFFFVHFDVSKTKVKPIWCNSGNQPLLTYYGSKYSFASISML